MTNSTAAAAGPLDLNTQQTGDLLGRLESFLPQLLQATNQALEEDVDGDPGVIWPHAHSHFHDRSRLI
jgi:hypothetical protein